MRRGELAAAFALVFAVAVAILGQGCGGDDNGPHATFVGNVSGVSPTQTSAALRSHPALAALDLILPSPAHAQSTCPALHILACATNGRDAAVCRRVDSNGCDFSVSLDVLDNDSGGTFFFVDDTNGNGREDSGESTAMLTNPLGAICNGSLVTLTDVAIDFLGGSATAASLVKDPDTCPPGSNPTAAPPLPTPTPYVYGASLNRPPSTMLAFLFGAGAVGLILPRRRQRP